jgi:hypothetical protein
MSSGTDMEFRYTRHQVARSARPDAETAEKMYLIKNVSRLRATYQIRLLTFAAAEGHKTLVLKVPRSCCFSASLKDLMRMVGKTMKREAI